MKHSLFWRLILPVMGIFVICLVLVSWYIPGSIQHNAELEALESAKNTVNQFKTIRKYYTQNVIQKVIGRDGLKGSSNHKNEKNSIPLPATMIHDLSDLLEEQGTNLKLYSAFPFPNRQSRKLDNFSTQAWQAIKSNPDITFSHTEETDAGTIVRVGIADLMVSEVCVSCHNSHPETPKSDWKLNDVRGVLEIQMNIEQQLAHGKAISYTIITMMLSLAILLSVVMAIIYRQSIGSRLNGIGAALREIASGEGDLTRRLDSKGHDEVSTIAKSFNEFVDKLEATIKEIQQATCSLSSTSDELSDITNSVSSAILQQDGQTEQIATAIIQLTASAKDISSHTSDAADTTKEADNITTKGQKIVTKSMQATDILASDVRKAAEVLGRLQEDSNRITGVLDVIKGIAEQTNLLALNAAIEAARAGEQGRGFAVVADEVRTLAARTQDSTTEIHEMTERLRSATEEAVSVMGTNQSQADQSVSLSRDVQGALKQISESMSDINSMNAHVATAATEQNTVVNAIHNNINDIVSLSSATAQGAKETRLHTEKLNEVVKRITSFTDQFKVSD